MKNLIIALLALGSISAKADPTYIYKKTTEVKGASTIPDRAPTQTNLEPEHAIFQ